MKGIKYLSLTNLVKFVKYLLNAENTSKFRVEVEKVCQLDLKDKVNYLKMIKVNVCNQKCPCCGRICGIESDHKCLYGHQMRGLNGSYIVDGKNKFALARRC